MNRQAKQSSNTSVNPDIVTIVHDIAQSFQIGTIISFTKIKIGYEDCNVIVQTDLGKYVTKIFASKRTDEDIERYIAIMRKVVSSTIHHPPFCTSADGSYRFTAHGVSAVVMEFVEGSTYYDTDSAPTDSERRAILSQMKKIHALDHRPSHLHDIWAVNSIRQMYDATKQLIPAEYIQPVEHIMARYEAIPTDTLPHAFVHGDFTKANVMRDADRVYILDFCIANWYPRIQELGKCIANLLYDPNDSRTLQETCDLVAAEYGDLTSAEITYIPDYARAAMVMVYLASYYEKHVNGIDTFENKYWLEMGREGIDRSLSHESLTDTVLSMQPTKSSPSPATAQPSLD